MKSLFYNIACIRILYHRLFRERFNDSVQKKILLKFLFTLNYHNTMYATVNTVYNYTLQSNENIIAITIKIRVFCNNL